MPDLPTTFTELDAAVGDPAWFRAAVAEHGLETALGRVVELYVQNLTEHLDAERAEYLAKFCAACDIERHGVPSRFPHKCGRTTDPALAAQLANPLGMDRPSSLGAYLPVFVIVSLGMVAFLLVMVMASLGT